MNEDYLWDKTGHDEEIEKLENALQAFRFQETAPPGLPAKSLPVKENEWRKFFRFRFPFALAAGAAVVLILFAVWLQLAGRARPLVEESATTTGKTPFVQDVQKEEPAQVPVPAPDQFQTPPKAGPQIVKTRLTIPARPRSIKTRARKPQFKNQELVLTAEEKHAYDQLMLALSITGSKLKIVRDKIDNIDERNARLTERK